MGNMGRSYEFTGCRGKIQRKPNVTPENVCPWCDHVVRLNAENEWECGHCHMVFRHWEKKPMETPNKTVQKAPWPDFAGGPIFEGDTIQHPSGEAGVVVFLPHELSDSDRWRVDYGGKALSRLCLQIGDKGQAVVVERP